MQCHAGAGEGLILIECMCRCYSVTHRNYHARTKRPLGPAGARREAVGGVDVRQGRATRPSAAASIGALADEFSRRVWASCSFLRHDDETRTVLNLQPDMFTVDDDGW